MGYIKTIPSPLPTGDDFAEASRSSGFVGIPYSKCDCQALIEKCLALVGIICNFRGSNHMWRELVADRLTLAECQAKYGRFIPGTLCFILKYDGSEVKRGYHDNLGAAVHVGIVLDGMGTVLHSTTGGVQFSTISAAGFNRVAKVTCIDYERGDRDEQVQGQALREKLLTIIDNLQKATNSLEEVTERMGNNDS
jgi:hypothetical protein